MASVHDVAAHILDRTGPVSTMKLQKLVYYAQAWHLVWHGAPLFPEPIEAWAKGPVVRGLYEQHRGKFMIRDLPVGDPTALSLGERDTVERIVNFYGSKSAAWLSDLTHREPPWRDARRGLPDGWPGTTEITLGNMQSYYSSL